jgi:KUP system potassium uptake protein
MSPLVHVSLDSATLTLADVLRDEARFDGPGTLQIDQTSYFLSKIELLRGDEPTMAPWRKRLFIATSYIAADAAEHFALPRNRTLIMGAHIEVQHH